MRKPIKTKAANYLIAYTSNLKENAIQVVSKIYFYISLSYKSTYLLFALRFCKKNHKQDWKLCRCDTGEWRKTNKIIS